MSNPVINNTRPFYKRTEFYLMLAAIIFGGLLGSGVLGPNTMLTKLIAMVVEALAVLGYTVGRTIAKSGVGTDQPGYLSSEFWMTLLGGGLLAIQGIDVVPSGSPWEALIAALLAISPVGAYGVSRGKVKASALTGALLVLILPALIGCSGWQAQSQNQLTTLHAALKAASGAGETVFKEACDEEATTCRDARRAAEKAACPPAPARDVCEETRLAAIDKAKTCDPLRACHRQRKEFDTAMVGGQLLVLDGMAIVGLGAAAVKPDLDAILNEVRKVLKAAQVTIRKLKLRGV